MELKLHDPKDVEYFLEFYSLRLLLFFARIKFVMSQSGANDYRKCHILEPIITFLGKKFSKMFHIHWIFVISKLEIKIRGNIFTNGNDISHETRTLQIYSSVSRNCKSSI